MQDLKYKLIHERGTHWGGSCGWFGRRQSGDACSRRGGAVGYETLRTFMLRNCRLGRDIIQDTCLRFITAEAWVPSQNILYGAGTGFS